MEIITFLNKPG